ncbi:MAG: hypothetical protein OQJ97_17810 [Rhodospirillales bacterium]|nr:hypothetical protein [Rhodospirillales bacterium]
MNFQDHTLATEEPFGSEPDGTKKSRPCLRCHEIFESEWAGERICRRCKTSSSWQNGDPYWRHRNTGKKRTSR